MFFFGHIRITNIKKRNGYTETEIFKRWVFKDQEFNEAKKLDDQAEEIFKRIKEAVDL